MKKLFWILSSLVLILIMVILIIALTNDSPDNPLKPYSLIIGLAFLITAGLIRINPACSGDSLLSLTFDTQG